MIDFSKLVPLYNEPHRFYHNLKHIHSMLRMIPEIKKEYPDINSNILSAMIWYHDAYHDPLALKQYNELLSASLFLQHNKDSSSGFVNHVKDGIYMAIMASAYHDKYNPKVCDIYQDSTRKLQEISIFLDLDLISLGCKYVEYTNNVINIYKEYLYYGINKDDFVAGRKQFLQSMLERIEESPNKSLFYNDFFTKKFNKQAKENIEFEMSNNFRLVL